MKSVFKISEPAIVFYIGLMTGLVFMFGCDEDCDSKTIAQAFYPSVITTNSAILDAEVSVECDAIISQKGLCWSVNPDPTLDDFITEAGASPEKFTTELTDLLDGQTYYVRPYVIDNDGNVNYGPPVIFETITIDDCTESLSDFQGNSYQAVCIGNQWWMSSSLKTKSYSDGTQIPSIAFKSYDNDPVNDNDFGLIYMHDEVDKERLCPDGWHVPTQEDFDILIEFLGGASEAGGKLKETGTRFWNEPNLASNESRFSARGGGAYTGDPEGFSPRGLVGWFMAEDFAFGMRHDNTVVGIVENVQSDGSYCRCVKDE